MITKMAPSSAKNELDGIVGKTPLLEITFEFRGVKRQVFVKAEQLNLTGSIKDRMALHIIKEAYRTGQLHTGDLIAEATSGNTGISFAAIGKAFGHDVMIYMPDWMSSERVALIKSYGAEVMLVSKEEGGFLGSIENCDKLAGIQKEQGVFLPHQFSNEANSNAHFLSTGPEIWSQFEQVGIIPDVMVAGVGTGGTIMGTGKYLKGKNPKIKLFALEPAESPTMSTGHKVGSHRIQGISDEFIPAIVHLDELDDVIAISDGDAILMGQKLATTLGLAVGISSGANFLGAIRAQEKLGADVNVATVFPDSNKKYLSTDLFHEEPVRESYLSNDVELISYRSFRCR